MKIHIIISMDMEFNNLIKILTCINDSFPNSKLGEYNTPNEKMLMVYSEDS